MKNFAEDITPNQLHSPELDEHNRKLRLWFIAWIGSIVYFALGKLAPFMAIPASFAYPIWPSAGIGLATIYLARWRGALGILCAAWWLNASIQADFLQPAQATLSGLAVAAAVTLQGAVASWVAWRRNGTATNRDPLMDLPLLLVLGIFVTGWISPAAGTLVPLRFGAIEQSETMAHFATWWLGDAAGILVASTVFLAIASARSRRNALSRFGYIAIPTGIAFSGCLLAFHFVLERQNRTRLEHFEEEVSRVENKISQSLVVLEEALWGLRNTIRETPEVSREHFAELVKAILDRNPSLHAISWNPLVESEAERRRLEETLSEQYKRRVEFVDRSLLHSTLRAHSRGNYVVTAHIEPFELNKAALGLDILQPLASRDYVLAAMTTGRIQTTGPIRLIQDQDEQLSVMILAPVLSRSDGHRRGVIVGILRLGTLLNNAMLKSSLRETVIRIAIKDIRNDLSYSVTGDIPPRAENPEDELTTTRTVQLPGSAWHLEAVTSLNTLIMDRDWLSWGVIWGGCSLSGLFSILLGTIVQRRETVSLEVAARTAELETATASLKANEMRLNNIIEGTNVGTWEWNIQTGETLFNERWAEIIGYRLEELEPISIETWERFCHPDDLENSDNQLRRHFRGESSFYECEARMRHRCGEWIWVSDRGRVFDFDNEGRPLRMFGTHQDISRQKRTEEQLRHKTEELDRFFANSLDLLCISDLKGRFIRLNPEWETTIGYPLHELVGTFFMKYVHPDDIEATQEALETLGDGESITSFTNRYRCADGSYRFIEWRSKPVGEVIYASARDITGHKNLQQKLQETAVRADEANRAKSAFLATMSHEIRTPLNAVIGMASLLKTTHLDEDQLQFANIIRTSSESLLALINDILDFSKIEAGQLSIERIPFSPALCLEEALQITGQRAQDKQIQLVADFANALPDQMTGDPLRVRQVLTNLISNAIKFTEEGEVKITASAIVPEGARSDLREVSFAVKDTGIGITKEALANLFQPFKQADATVTRRFGGTGLGLSISRRIANALDGQIDVESEPGTGSTFTFRFKAPVIESSPEQQRATANTSSLFSRKALLNAGNVPELPKFASREQILVAEDNMVNQQVMEKMLQKLELETRIVPDGKEAVEACRQQHFKLVFMDLHMPRMGGEEAARAIRKLHPLREQPTIVALSADVLATDLTARKDSPFDGFLPKPISLESLARAIADIKPEWVRQTDGHAADAQAANDDTITDNALTSGTRTGLAEETPIIDESQLENLKVIDTIDPDADIVGQLLKTFDSESSTLLKQALRSFDSRNWTQLSEDLHAIKGSCGNLALARACSQARELESMARSDREKLDSKMIHDLFETIESSIVALRTVLGRPRNKPGSER